MRLSPLREELWSGRWLEKQALWTDLSPLVFIVWVIFLYVDTEFGFYGTFLCLVGCFSMIIWHLLFWVSYMHVFCIFVFAPVQCSWACFTWNGALELRSSLLLILLLFVSRNKPPYHADKQVHRACMTLWRAEVATATLVMQRIKSQTVELKTALSLFLLTFASVHEDLKYVQAVYDKS